MDGPKHQVLVIGHPAEAEQTHRNLVASFTQHLLEGGGVFRRLKYCGTPNRAVQRVVHITARGYSWSSWHPRKVTNVETECNKIRLDPVYCQLASVNRSSTRKMAVPDRRPVDKIGWSASRLLGVGCLKVYVRSTNRLKDRNDMDNFFGRLCSLAPVWATWVLFGLAVLLSIRLTLNWRTSRVDSCIGLVGVIFLTFWVKPYFVRIHGEVIPAMSQARIAAEQQQDANSAMNSFNVAPTFRLPYDPYDDPVTEEFKARIEWQQRQKFPDSR